MFLVLHAKMDSWQHVGSFVVGTQASLNLNLICQKLRTQVRLICICIKHAQRISPLKGLERRKVYNS